LIPEEKLLKVKRFFEEKGIKVSGGITTTGKTPIANHFSVYCYTNEENLSHLKKIVEFTAKHFDEIIFDDFYFTSCKCESCIKAKGNRSWSEFRMKLMKNVSRDVILRTAKSVDPNVNMIIKYPNWYEYYQYTGYNLKEESEMFDMIYTGTESRDPVYHQQNIQPYQSYLITRYLENVKSGKNGGGWLDPLDMRCVERYAEQIRLTLLAKAKEITLFQYGSLFEELNDGEVVSFIAPAAGAVFKKTDSYIGKLGNPVGLASYRPYNSSGEAYLHSYLGMLGVPIELVPYYPTESKTILLTESAKDDPAIIEKMKKSLLEGKNIVITSGFLKAAQDLGINDLILAQTNGRKFETDLFTDLNFSDIYVGKDKILFPQVEFGTNDSWKEIAAIDGESSYPVLLQTSYGAGIITLIVVPDNFADLYKLPAEIITMIKKFLLKDFPVRVESLAGVALFLYDNNTFAVHSFLDHKTKVNIVPKESGSKLVNLISGRELKSKEKNGKAFEVKIAPHSYRVFRIEKNK
jgi:hypothetical protein